VTESPFKFRRRWFAFSLRTLFVMVTAFGCWLGYQLHWIRVRELFLASRRGREIAYTVPPQPACKTPGILALLGQSRKITIYVADADDIEEAKRLFPESMICHAGTIKTPVIKPASFSDNRSPSNQAER
jgi:hypothetical protein